MSTPLNLPVAYRLVEKVTEKGTTSPSLEGLFLEYQVGDDKIQGAWRSLETLPEWQRFSPADPFA